MTPVSAFCALTVTVTAAWSGASARGIWNWTGIWIFRRPCEIGPIEKSGGPNRRTLPSRATETVTFERFTSALMVPSSTTEAPGVIPPSGAASVR